MRKVSELVANPINPRTLKTEAFKELKRSIENDPDFLQARPILVTMADGRENTVIAGNMRLRAVTDLGWVEVPAVEITGATEEQENEWMLKDNLHKGEWDFDALANNFDLDFLKEVGFDPKDLDKAIGAIDNSKDDEFDAEKEAEAIAEPIVQRGDIWQLGEHRIMCGDSTKLEDVEKLMDGKKADMVFTDPPYGVSYVGKTKDALKIENDAMDEEGTAELWAAAYSALREILKDGGIVYATVPPGPLHIMFASVMKDYGDLRQIMVWVKDRFVLGRSDYHYRHEPILYGWKNTGKHEFRGGRDKDTVWEVARPSANREHPTMKPIELVERALIDGSLIGEVVYDCFSGSGSTLIACENTKRVCCGMELDPKYCDVIIKRWEIKTGKKATKLSS